ncbi:DUF4062 domain-containing protein [Actinoplanes sp. NPDC004185]
MAALGKRYQVFLSSTYVDLRDERQAVISALLQLDAIPAGMELFPAANDDAWSLIERVIDECDYYLLVVGGRYGSVDLPEDLSYTEREYDYAVLRKKPIMAFIHAEPDSIPVGKAEVTEAGRARLERFLAKVKKERHVKFWKNADDLPGKVALSFSNFIRIYPAVGWIRADEQATPELLAETNTLRKKVAELEKAIERNRTLPPPGTEHLKQGSDLDEMTVWLSAQFTPHGEYQARHVTITEDAKFTWDDVLNAIGPALLDESSEKNLHRVINDWLTAQFWIELDVEEKLKKKLGNSGLNPAQGRWHGWAISFDEEDFGTVIIQLVALGLIEQSGKKKAISDRGTYWSLTAYGRTRALQLRARSKEGDS